MRKTLLTSGICIVIAIQGWGQVRQDINSFSTAQQQLLANLMMEYITPEIIEKHCNYDPDSDMYPMIHSAFSFLPFHHTLLEGMEDFLILKGHPEFVPLPYWKPNACAPVVFQTCGPNGNGIDPDCSIATCNNGDGPCSNITNWCPPENYPNYLGFTIQAGSNNDICDWPMDPLVPMGDMEMASINGLSNKIESPYHNNIHVNMGGVMGYFRSPSAPIFWLWHAYVDDLWKHWQCTCTNQTSNLNSAAVDLYMKDQSEIIYPERDRGEQPNIYEGPMWESEDIWVRTTNDGFSNGEHQNPEYYSNPGLSDYVYVRVRNRGCNASVGTEQLKLYWSKAGTSLSYPSYWNGSLTTAANKPIGDIIATVTIPVIAPGASKIIEIPWHPVNPDDYVNTDANSDPSLFWIEEPQPHHFCLLARIEATNDPIIFTNGTDLGNYVKQNNNVVWKNISVVDLDPLNTIPGGWLNDMTVGAAVFAGDPWGEGGTFDFEFKNPEHYKGNPVTAEAEVSITLNPMLWEKWVAGGFKRENIEIAREDKNKVIITGSPARLKNITFEPDERALMSVGFNFLSKQVTGQTHFRYQAIQRRSSDNYIVGGETYDIKVPGREGFYANAGADKTISEGQSADLNASDIGEAAIYNWYDMEGNLIYTGMDMTVSPEITKQYKLEVIATADGLKDYDEVQVQVKEHEILNMSPNPASNNVTINYKTTNATSGYFMITQPYGTSSNYIFDVNLTSRSIDLSAYAPGIYTVIMVVNGIVADAKSLVVQ